MHKGTDICRMGQANRARFTLIGGAIHTIAPPIAKKRTDGINRWNPVDEMVLNHIIFYHPSHNNSIQDESELFLKAVGTFNNYEIIYRVTYRFQELQERLFLNCFLTDKDKRLGTALRLYKTVFSVYICQVSPRIINNQIHSTLMATDEYDFAVSATHLSFVSLCRIYLP